MSDENAQPSPEPEVAPSLDDVISEFHVDPPTPAEPQQPAQPQAPTFQPVDPLNDEQWRNYQAQQMQRETALQSQLQDVSTKLTQLEQERVNAKVEADIKSAVKTVSEKVENADPVMVELYLEKRATESEGFRKIWENREANPAAYTKALNAISGELSEKFSFKADPQLAENHRAAIQSQQSGNALPASEFNNSSEERLANAKSEAERQVIWNQIKSGG